MQIAIEKYLIKKIEAPDIDNGTPKTRPALITMLMDSPKESIVGKAQGAIT